MITRRCAMAGGLAALAWSVGRGRAWAAPLESAFAAIEAESGGRLGVAALDTGSGELDGYRAAERFPLCSTFKVLAAGAVLARVDAGLERLERRVAFEARALVPYSPVTAGHAGGAGMTLAELCDAAITRSDNTAGNLLLEAVGGPEGLTTFALSLGDGVTRLDRAEPTLNEALPGDPRDTTSPAAMAQTLAKLALGSALTQGSRDRLTGWLLDSRTGAARLRAGLPKNWRVGDKTGSGERGTTNDVGVLWPPEGAPIVVAVYLTGSQHPPETRNAAIAAVARAVAAD